MNSPRMRYPNDLTSEEYNTAQDLSILIGREIVNIQRELSLPSDIVLIASSVAVISMSATIVKQNMETPQQAKRAFTRWRKWLQKTCTEIHRLSA